MSLPDPTLFIKYTTYLIIILTLIIIFVDDKKWRKHQKAIFWIFIITVMGSTLYLAGHTVHKNIVSETGGPVHWHADFEVWHCNEKQDLINPTGFINKVGSPLFHEHNDDRIHVEGVVNAVEDVNVGAFFKVVGGELTTTSLKYPLEGGELLDVKNGDTCNGQPAELKVYVNGIRNADPANYMYYPHPAIPPGDCIIVEFGVNLPETTDRICNFWAANGWTYDNFKELRKEKHNQPAWRNENWQYIDGQGMVRIN